MRKTIVLMFILLIGCGQALADVLVLDKGLYIDQVTIIKMDQEVVQFERRGEQFEIDPALVKEVTQVVPAGMIAIAPEAVVMPIRSKDEKMDTDEVMEIDELAEPGEDEVIAGDDNDEAGMEMSEQELLDAADQVMPEEEIEYVNESKQSFTIGFLNGGGSLIGIDYQILLGDSNVALQVGAGYIGYDAAINFYFEPNMDSEYISLTYWNQGSGDVYIRYIGITYGYKAFGWLNGQIGLGYTLDVSGKMEEAFIDAGNDQVSTVLLLYSIGAYF